MQIQQIQKEYSTNAFDKVSATTKKLKDLKNHFIQITKQTNPSQNQTIVQSIQQTYKQLGKYLQLDQRKVLKAYISYHLESINEESELKLTDSSQNYNKQTSLTSYKKDSSYQNKLLQIFKNWFKVNNQIKNGLINKKQVLLNQSEKTQQILILLSERTYKGDIQNRKEGLSHSHIKSNKKQFCQTTLLILLISKLNLCIILLLKRRFNKVQALVLNCKQTFKILLREIDQKNKRIQQNIQQIEHIHQLQQKQTRKFLLQIRKNQLINYNKPIQSLQYLKQDQNKQWQRNEQTLIQQKYQKRIDIILQKNKQISNEKIKLRIFLNQINEKLLKIQNYLYFQTNTQIAEIIKQKTFTIRLFNNEKVNKALQSHLKCKRQTNPSAAVNNNFIDEIFNSQNKTNKSIFLTIQRSRKTIDISLKDYFNVCLMLKKTNKNRQAILYFQILIYNFRKKDILHHYCIKQIVQQEVYESDQNIDQIERKSYKKMIYKNLKSFVKNQQLIKIIIFSLLNLIQLYDQQKAFYQSTLTLNYLQRLVQIKILTYITKSKEILIQNNHSNKFLREKEQHADIKISEVSIICQKLYQKYNSILQEIKLKIIKTIMNSQRQKNITIYHQNSNLKTFYPGDPTFNQQTNLKTINSNRKINQNKRKPFISATISPNMSKTMSATMSTNISANISTHISATMTPNIRKLQQKQNQLLQLTMINSHNSQFIKKNMFYSTPQSPNKSIIKNNCFNNNSFNNNNFNNNNNSSKTNFSKISKQNLISQQTKNNKSKGLVYKLNRKYLKRQILTKGQENIKNDSLKQSNQQTSQNIDHVVKFSLAPVQQFQPSLVDLSSLKGIQSDRKKIHKQHTLNFLQTSKSICQSSKITRLAEYRQKLLQNKSQLENYIKLSFKKLNTILKNPINSSISLNEIKSENIDLDLQIDQLFNDFNELLKSLKIFCSHSQQSFQRQLLIQSKIRLVQLVKQKIGPQKLIQVYDQTLEDLTLIKNSDKRVLNKKKVLWQLAQCYYSIKQLKKCISTYLELARIGQPVGYLKLGELYMLTKQYNNCIRYYEKYAVQVNNDLNSKIKLAHAYSKIPQYYMKTMDMLTSILLQTGNNSKFKQEIYQRKYDDKLIQSGVILLSSLHFKNQNIDKAIQICENYCKINIKNHRVLHILGGYYRHQDNIKKSFQCYLNALENNPTHYKSLIQLTEFICEGYEYKSHAIQLLRKCYCLESRNYQLLTTLIRFLDCNEQPFENKQTINIEYPILLKYAEILKQSKNNGYSSQNFYQQATLVYQWALNLLDKNICIANLDQIQIIYKNLGEICMKTGDFIKSETYYKLYLSEIQKYVNRSNINESLRSEKVSKTKMEIYYLLGKVKKQQKIFKKAIQYFDRSYQLQKKFNQKLDDLSSYFYLFEVGHCYFLLEEYQIAQRKFNDHKNYLMNFIQVYDQVFFKSQRNLNVRVPQFLKRRKSRISGQKIRNYLQRMNFRQSQTSQKDQIDDNTQDEKIEYIFKKNYFQNQLYIAFCCDQQRRFIESKQIYKKILDYFSQGEEIVKEKERIRKNNKQQQKDKEQQLRNRQKSVRPMFNCKNEMNEQFLGFKKVALINLANIYKLEGVENKYKQTIELYIELCPEHSIDRVQLVNMSEGQEYQSRKCMDLSEKSILSQQKQKRSYNLLNIFDRPLDQTKYNLKVQTKIENDSKLLSFEQKQTKQNRQNILNRELQMQKHLFQQKVCLKQSRKTVKFSKNKFDKNQQLD